MQTSIFAAACLFLAIVSSCLAVDYTVGDSDGWGLGIDYSSWRRDKVFTVGDNLVFKYVQGHTLAEVNYEDYNSCTNISASMQNSGYTEIPLSTPGPRYFLCTVTDHCLAGMKLAVIVSGLGWSATIPPPGISTVPQTIYSHAPATLLSSVTLALPLLLPAINQ